MHARVGGDGPAGRVDVAIDGGDAGLVVRRFARRRAGALGEDQDLTAFGQTRAGLAHHVLQRLGVGGAVDGDHLRLPGEPAEEGQGHQLLLHHETGVVQEGERGDDVQHALVLGGDQGRAGRAMLQPAHLDLDPGDPAQAEQDEARPQLDHRNGDAVRHQQRRRQADGEQRHRQVEPQGEDQGSDGRHTAALFGSEASASASAVGPGRSG